MDSRPPQRERVEILRRLHQGPRILVLPNVWDVVTARIVEAAGFSALATTSAGVAFALGYPDGERISRAEMVAAVRRIAARVRVPVTADMEAGYGRTPQAAAETAREVIAAGAAGLNLEDAPADGDGLFDVALQAERVRAARESAEAAGVPLVINARTDVFLGPEPAVEDAIARGRAYLEAGADCVFAIGAQRPDDLRAMGDAFGGRLSIYVAPGSPPLAELAGLGVARVTFGPGLMGAAYASLQRTAEQLLGLGEVPDELGFRPPSPV